MEDEGREEKRDPLERIADALEKLASDPEIEIEAGPPICPHCGKMNPEIRTPPQDEQTGLMAELVIQCQCMTCNNSFYIGIESYSVHRTSQTLMIEMEERKAGFSE